MPLQRRNRIPAQCGVRKLETLCDLLDTLMLRDAVIKHEELEPIGFRDPRIAHGLVGHPRPRRKTQRDKLALRTAPDHKHRRTSASRVSD